MKTFQGITRPIAQIDFERFPELKLIVDACAQCEPDAVLDLANSPLADFADDLVVVEAVGGGDYLYLHYGATVSSDAGLSMQGKLTSDFVTGIGKKFAKSYDTALRVNRAMYSVNKAAVTHTTHSWQRMSVPFPAKKGERPARVVSFVRRLVWVEDILADFARDTNFLGGTLEPIVEENGVVDFLLLSLTEIDEVLGRDLTSLSELYGRPITAVEVSGILAAADGEGVIKTELPSSLERFGRRFFLMVTGGARQPVFALTDSTDMLNARQEAEEKRRTMEDFAGLASDWMWETDASDTFTHMSAAIEEQTGSKPERYIGVNWYDIEDVPENVEAFAAHRSIREARAPFSDFVYKGFCDDGRALWIRANGRPVFDQTGAFVGYRGTGSNITAEVEATQALEAQKAALEDFAATASDWMWESDTDHKITMLTDAVTAYAGYPPSFFIGKSRLGFADLPDNKAAFDAHIQDINARKPFQDLIYRIQARNGSFRWFKVSGVPRFDETGAFCGYRGTGTDITGETDAKLALEQQKSAMEEFAETASDWKWETDRQHRFSMISDVIEQFVGLPSAYIGKTRFELFDHPENKEAFKTHLDDLNAHRPFRDFIYANCSNDKGRVWIRISGKPRFDADGTFLGYRGTGSDITSEIEAKQALEESRAAMQDFASTASDWLWEVDENHILTMMSAAIEQFTGKPQSAYVGTSRYDLIGDRANADALRLHREDIAARRPFSNFVYQVKLDDGRTMWARANGKPRYNGDGRFIGYRGTGTNITEEVEARAQAAQRSQELAQAHRLGRLGSWSYSRATGMVTLSPEFLELTGFPDSARVMSGKRFAAFVSRDHRDAVEQAKRRLLATKQTQSVDMVFTRARCEPMDMSVTVRAVDGADGKVQEVFGTVQDISERKSSERELETLAFHDPLTSLGNRALFSRELDEALRRSHKGKASAGLLLLDLDHFKEVNDTLGHAAGDELLCRVAERLKQSMGARGQVFRLGGDEFAVILPKARSAAELGAAASNIISAFSGTVKLSDGSVHISTSIGMVMVPDQAKDADASMRFADLALYEAKSAGRNRALLFHQGLDRDVQDRVSLARDLREAIENDTLDVHFQMQVDVLEGRVSGFEALVRWNHPTRGPIPPSKFIPIAEGSRLIADLGAWMLRKVCAQGKAWLDAGGAPLQMAVNLSVAQLWYRDVEHDVRQTLEDTGFPPELLCVELTESVFSDDALPRIERLFAKLKALGVQIALDDFGTGYSSLQYLNALSVDKLKIDRSFVVDCDRNPEQLRLLQGIVGLGRGLGLTLVVEGVESEAELQVVCDLGCEEVQGFFFAQPKAFHEACLDAAHIEAHYGFDPVLWKSDAAQGHVADAGRSFSKRRAG